MPSGAGSRQKGHQYERDVANLYRAIGYNARRGWQQAHGDVADVSSAALPFAIECKCQATLANPWRALDQATQACKSAQIPIMHAKRTSTAIRGLAPLVVLYETDWIRLLVGIQRQIDRLDSLFEEFD